MKTFASQVAVTPSARGLRPVALAAVLSLGPGLTQAQQAPAEAASAAQPAAGEDGLNLERIVITGASTARTKMKQSVSSSTVDGEQIQNSGASSAADVLRSVPGVRAEASGGEGNANLGVRGLPMSDGGGRYVQIQEDGLPIVLFGDMSFATADQLVRADLMTDSLEAIRGGSSATMTTNGPGAIVNFLTKNGTELGGVVQLGMGLNHNQQRVDVAYATALAPDLKLQVGGFYRVGEGLRQTDVRAENGGQVRLVLTKDLGQGSYLRLNIKSLNDSTPTYLPVPVALTGNRITEIAGVDPRQAFFINSHFTQDGVLDRHGAAVLTNPTDGLTVRVNAVGAEGQINLGEGWRLTNRLRIAAISGRFIGVFPAGSQPTDYTGSTPVFSAHIFNSSLDNMGNAFNDLRLQKEMALAGGDKLTWTGGLFAGSQRVAQTWYWNRYNIGLTGSGAALYDNAGLPTSEPVGDASTVWGGCCFRSYDVTVRALSPYAAVTWDVGPFTLDASLRRDALRGSGSQRFGDDSTGASAWNPARTNAVNWSTSGTSWSLGGNYQIERHLAAFARISHGESWKAPDRVIWDTNVDSGAAPYPLNKLDQYEMGLKYKGQGFSAFVTAFYAKTKEGAGYELTTQTVKENSYEAKGLEAEVALNWDAWRVAAGATLTSASITSGDNQGNTPRRQARLIYQIAPSYNAENWQVGASLIGTTSSYAQDDNQVVLPGYATVNLFANYQVNDRWQLSLLVGNLFNTLGYTEAEAQNNLGDNPLYVARAINGRSVKAAVRYTF